MIEEKNLKNCLDYMQYLAFKYSNNSNIEKRLNKIIEKLSIYHTPDYTDEYTNELIMRSYVFEDENIFFENIHTYDNEKKQKIIDSGLCLIDIEHVIKLIEENY